MSKAAGNVGICIGRISAVSHDFGRLLIDGLPGTATVPTLIRPLQVWAGLRPKEA